jgi:Mrp family chromosome partitioning ATPase
VLAEKYPLDKAMLWYGEDRPSVLPLGGGAADEAQTAALLSGAPLRRLVRRLRRQFDTLVIDGPSISTSPAIRSLAPLASSTLMIVEWDKTDAALVANAVEGLDLRKVAIIFNRVDLARYGRFKPARPGASLAAA